MLCARGSSVQSFGAPRAQYGSSASQEAGMRVVLPVSWSVWWYLIDSQEGMSETRERHGLQKNRVIHLRCFHLS